MLCLFPSTNYPYKKLPPSPKWSTLPPPALPALPTSFPPLSYSNLFFLLWQPRLWKMTSPPEHGDPLKYAPLLYLQYRPGERCQRRRRPIRPCKRSSTTKLLGVHPLTAASVPLKHGLRIPLPYTLLHRRWWATHLVLVPTVVFTFLIISAFGNQLTGHVVRLIPLGYSSPSLISPSSLASPASSWTQLSPLLDSRSPLCMKFDLGYELNYMPNMNESAVHPPVTFMQLVIVLQPFKWPVNIQIHGPVSVYQVLQHLHQYLQGSPNAEDLQKSKLGCNVSQTDRFREQSRPNEFHSGQKRIDFLGRHRLFRGLSLEPGPRCVWGVHLSDRWWVHR